MYQDMQAASEINQSQRVSSPGAQEPPKGGRSQMDLVAQLGAWWIAAKTAECVEMGLEVEYKVVHHSLYKVALVLLWLYLVATTLLYLVATTLLRISATMVNVTRVGMHIQVAVDFS